MIFPQNLGCRKWGCNKWGLKGCLAALPGNRLKSAFFALFLPFSPFSGGCEAGKSRKRRKKAFFLRYPQICLNPHLLNPHSRHSKEYFPVSGRQAIPNQFAQAFFPACPCNKKTYTLIRYVYTALWQIRPVKVHLRTPSPIPARWRVLLGFSEGFPQQTHSSGYMARICLLIRLAFCIGQGPMPKIIPQTILFGTPSVIYARINSPKQFFPACIGSVDDGNIWGYRFRGAT